MHMDFCFHFNLSLNKKNIYICINSFIVHFKTKVKFINMALNRGSNIIKFILKNKNIISNTNTPINAISSINTILNSKRYINTTKDELKTLNPNKYNKVI